MKPPLIANPQTEILLAVGLYAVSIWLVWDAYERRGRPRSFWAGIFLP